MKLSLGPLQYFWNRERLFAFYESLRDAPVDIVYLGETVCAKRRALDLDDWLRIAHDLRKAGKEIILSTLSLIEAEAELAMLQRIAAIEEFAVEANDMAAVQLRSGYRPFVIGPHINVYNPRTLRLLEGAGAIRWVVPMELGKETLSEILRERPAGLEVELLAFGRLPLAFSARCFSARANNRGKDQCGFICGEYEDGMLINTQEDQPFLLINGIQIQSAATCNLIGYYAELRDRGIDILRLSPQAEGLPEIIATVRAVIDGRIEAQDAARRLQQYETFGGCDGYWNGAAGIRRLQETTG